MAQPLDPYRALGIRRDATEAEVKAAHRRLAKRFHPDTASGDRERFLRVQEAYRVLSDPLLRREWDARHAPGPVRADRPPGPARPAANSRRTTRPRQQPAPGRDGQAETTGEAGAPPDPSRRPRSSHAYTWSAADVPWWEEGTSETRRPPGRRRPARPAPAPPGERGGRAAPAAEAGPGAPGAETGPGAGANAQSAFDVYNRSSGAAWSMAARAYFRRGDQELPRRGSFQYEGTHVLTGARARVAAEAAARRRAEEQRRAAASSTAQATPPPSAHAGPAATEAAHAVGGSAAHAYTEAGVSRDAQQIHRMRQAFRRRTQAAAWPSLRERLIYALLAWAPAAIAIGYGGASVTGCDRASIGCPAGLETAQAIAIALSLGLLVALPKLAYIGALSTVGSLFVGLLFVGVLAIAGVQPPLSVELTLAVGGVLLVAYAATAIMTLARDPGTRPWLRVVPR